MIPFAAAQAPLVFVALLATSIWVGGFVAVVVVARVSGRRLDAASRIAFFRDFGRVWGIVGGAALAVAIASGAALLSERDWDATAAAAVLVTVSLVLATLAGVAQARWMTRVRQRATHVAAEERIIAQLRRGSRLATALRAAIGILTLALLLLVAVLVSS